MSSSVYGTGSNLFQNILMNDNYQVLSPTQLDVEIVDILFVSFSQTLCRLQQGGIRVLGLPVEIEEMSATLFGQDSFTAYLSSDGLLRSIRDEGSVMSPLMYKLAVMNGKGEIIAISVSNEIHFFDNISSLDSPIVFDFPDPSLITKIVAGASHFLFLTSSSVFALGDNRFGQCGISQNPSINKPSASTINHIEFFDGLYPAKIIAGDFHSAVTTEDGALYVFGSDIDGQCGGFGGFSPTLVEFGEEAGESKEVEEVESVAAGSSHTIVRMKDGKVWVAGLNHTGQLGLGDVESRNKFALLPFSESHKILKIFCSRWNSFFITKTTKT